MICFSDGDSADLCEPDAESCEVEVDVWKYTLEYEGMRRVEEALEKLFARPPTLFRIPKYV